MNIRQGKIEDFEKLNHEWAWNPEKEWQQKAQKDYIKGIQAGRQEFLVIENEDQIIGEFHIYWKKNDTDEADGKKRAYLSAFRIHPEFRHQGFGKKLMTAVLERIKEKGFSEVTIGAYKHEPEIQKLYEKWGFTEFVKEAIEETTDGKPTYLLFLKKL